MNEVGSSETSVIELSPKNVKTKGIIGCVCNCFYCGIYNSMVVLVGNDCIPYSRKFLQTGENKIYAEKRFTACLLSKDSSPSNFAEKTFMKSHKTSKFAKVFFLKSFLLYGTYM